MVEANNSWAAIKIVDPSPELLGVQQVIHTHWWNRWLDLYFCVIDSLMAYYSFCLWSWIMSQFIIHWRKMSKWRHREMNEVRIGDRVVCVHNPINISCCGELEQRKKAYKHILRLRNSNTPSILLWLGTISMSRFSFLPFLPQSGAPSIMAWLEPNEGGLQLLLRLLPLQICHCGSSTFAEPETCHSLSPSFTSSSFVTW